MEQAYVWFGYPLYFCHYVSLLSCTSAYFRHCTMTARCGAFGAFSSTFQRGILHSQFLGFHTGDQIFNVKSMRHDDHRGRT